MLFTLLMVKQSVHLQTLNRPRPVRAATSLAWKLQLKVRRLWERLCLGQTILTLILARPLSSPQLHFVTEAILVFFLTM